MPMPLPTPKPEIQTATGGVLTGRDALSTLWETVMVGTTLHKEAEWQPSSAHLQTQDYYEEKGYESLEDFRRKIEVY